MKRLFCMAAMAALFVFSASAAFAAEPAADADVKGLWLKVTKLPSTVSLEDMSQEEDEPYFIYSFEGNDGDGPTIAVGRTAQDDNQEKFVKDFVAAWTKVMNADRFDLA